MNLEIELGGNSEQALKVLCALAQPLDYSIREIKSPSQNIEVVPRRLNPADFIFLEAAKRGNHEYHDLMISMYNLRSAYADATLNLQDTARTNDGVPYIGNINHQQAMDLVIASDFSPSNLRLFADFLREVREGAYNGKNVFDGSGIIIPSERLKLVDDEITGRRSPYRGRWISDSYKMGEDGSSHVSFYVIDNDESLN